MHSVKLAVAAALLAVGANSQRNYFVAPDSVPIGTRRSWCVTQQSSCPLLCLQPPSNSSTTAANDCDPETLTYECICGDGLTPNASEYSQTLPYFLCSAYGDQCVAGCGGATSCQSACRADNPCGAQDPTRVNVTSTTSSATATGTNGPDSTDGVVYNGLGNDAKPTDSRSSSSSGSNSDNQGNQNAGNAMLNVGQSYGLAVVFSGLFAGLALFM